MARPISGIVNIRPASRYIDSPQVATTPEENQFASLRKPCFSDPAVESIVNMTRLTLESKYETSDAIRSASLKKYLKTKITD